MRKGLGALVFAVVFAWGAAARADEGPSFTGPLTPTETQFVASVRQDLMARFPHVGDAEKAGYVRYTSADNTGAISYANQQWTADPTHPSQLWYDQSGNLMGADFSVPRPHGEARPQVWGIDPGRFYEFNGHVHFVAQMPDGKMYYDQWVWNDDFVKAAGDLAKPSADTLVKLGKVPNASNVTTIFDMPTQWDLIVWLKPHPAGEFRW